MTHSKKKQPTQKSSLLGVGFDGDDGHTRLTRGKNFALVGGSEETHSFMQETAVKVNERLDKSGRRLEDVPPKELQDICHDVIDSIGGSPGDRRQ